MHSMTVFRRGKENGPESNHQIRSYFAGGLILGALGAVALAKGKKAGGIKPLASSLLSAGLDVQDKVMTGIDGVREELADVVAEAQVKSQMRRESQEEAEAAATVQAKPVKKTRRVAKAKKTA